MTSSFSDLQQRVFDFIQRGPWKPGERLPNTHDFAAKLGVPVREVQGALSGLAARGYLERKQGVGTVLRRNRATPNIVLFCGTNLHQKQADAPRAMVEAVRTELNRRGYHLTLVDDLASYHGRNWRRYSEAMEQIRRQVDAAAPVGVIETGCAIRRYPDLYERLHRVPLVRLSSQRGDIGSDHPHFIRTSLEHLAGQGCRKVAFLRPHRPYTPDDDLTWEEIHRLGFLRCVIREIPRSEDGIASMAYELMNLLIREWKGLRKNYVPDGLVVDDDVAMEGVAAALRKSHLDIPGEFRVITRASQGVPRFYGLPVDRYEVSQEEVGRRLVDFLEARMARMEPAPVRVQGCLRLETVS
ncbi:MAG TPA: substrate-binding domain-containing protein [Chthoniobacteraceae bacterium]|nr:substrate-binding domain-containing protein [Chthoniobacteraceae bacterium]